MHTSDTARSLRRDETRRDETIKAVARSAHELFRQLGYEDTTVEAIALRAGISRRTFFNYYPSKAAVFWADPEGHRSRVVQLLDRTYAAGKEWHGVAGQLIAWGATLDEDQRVDLRTMFSLIESSAELLSFTPELRRATISAACRPLLEHARTPVDRTLRIAAAHSMVSATQTFVRAWAQDSELELVEELTTALLAIADTFRSMAENPQTHATSNRA